MLINLYQVENLLVSVQVNIFEAKHLFSIMNRFYYNFDLNIIEPKTKNA